MRINKPLVNREEMAGLSGLSFFIGVLTPFYGTDMRQGSGPAKFTLNPKKLQVIGN
jgi:hypothetical protein